MKCYVIEYGRFQSVLDYDSSEVATTISGYIAKKLLKRSKCKDCEKKLTVHDQDLQNDQYLTLLSRGGLFVPSKELAEFVYSCFLILDFVEGDILPIGQVTRSAMYVLKYYGPKCEFCCQYHLDWGVKFASKIVVNVYFNNKQKQAKDCVRKDSMESFKTRQRRKQFILRQLYLVLWFLISKIDYDIRVIGVVFS